MREIKLKAFDKRTKCLVDIDGFRYLKGEKIKIFFTDEDGFDEQCVCDKKYIELIRSTGLHDKNCVEIYEGDIVKVEYINDGESYVEVVVVSWNEKEASYAPFNWNYQCDGCDCHTEITSIEVIGNIWEGMNKVMKFKGDNMIEKVLEYFKNKNVRCKIVRDDRPEYGDFIAIFGYGELTREDIVEDIVENNLLCMFFETSISEELHEKHMKEIQLNY